MNTFEKTIVAILALTVAFEFGHNIGSRPVRTRKDSRESRQSTPRQITHQRFVF
ncbi:hypothetical protein D3C77_318520 [compost metagenome]